MEKLKAWLEDITKLEERLSSEACNSGIVLLSAGQKRLQQLLESLREPISRIDYKVSIIYETLDLDQRERILKWTSIIPYEELHNAAKSGKTPGTGEWILQHDRFLQWRDSDSSNVLWLYGSR